MMQTGTLHECLEFAYVDKLKAIYGIIADRGSPKLTRKDQLVAEMSRIVLSRAQEEWNRLSKFQKLAVQEAVHTRNGYFDEDKFVAKYGKLPGKSRNSYRDDRSKNATRLDLFLHKDDRMDYPVWLPRDLKERLQEFVPEPAAATVPTKAELPETVNVKTRRHVPSSDRFRRYDIEIVDTPVPIAWSQMENAARANLFEVLSLVEKGKISVSAKTRRPTAASMKKIAEVLDQGDFYASTDVEADVGPIQAFAWPLLLQAGRLVRLNGSKLSLTTSGRKALSSPPHETIRHLWTEWINTEIIDEFSRVEAIKGQTRGRGKRAMLPADTRRWAICDALEQCPPGGVVSFGDFAKFMVAADCVFHVTSSPWTLYAGDPHYGYQRDHGDASWDVFKDRYLMCFLMEYVATLGMIDVAFIPPAGARPKPWETSGHHEGRFLSRYDGLRHFRLTALGSYALGLSDSYAPATPEAVTPVSVFPDRRIVVQEGFRIDQDERAMLRLCADEEDSSRVWRLNSETILKSLEAGLDIGALRAFLAERDSQPLPELVDGYLTSIVSNVRAIRPKGTGVLFECDSAETLDKLMSDKTIAKTSLRAGERMIVVRTSSEASFRKAARTIGYGFDDT